MSDLSHTFQQRHQEKLGQLKRRRVDEPFLDEIQALIADLRQAGAVIANPAERGQLRALMRFWGNVVYDHLGVYPDTMLQPLDPARAPPPEEPPRPSFPLVWALVGGAAVIVIAVGLVALAGPIRTLPVGTPGEEGTAVPYVPPASLASHTVVGAELGEGDRLKTAANTFCLGTPEIISEFTLSGIEPGMEWRWEVKREDEVVTDQPALPWREATQRATIRVLIGDSGGVEPGQYDLLVYVSAHVVGVHSFQVLDTTPRIFNLAVADVPKSAKGTSDGNEFEAGMRVIYLSYEYEGLCSELDVAHTLYREGEPIQESVDTWSGAPQGQTQVSFQAPGDLPFSPGDYGVAVAVAGEEQGRVGFTIGGEVTEILPAFGDIVVALGVQPDGTPILTAPDNRFDWNTTVIYGIFDYVKMNDGLRWAAVWMRNGQEVARREEFWDVETAGTEGTRWVAYHDEYGWLLPGGNYSVTLYVDNVGQSTADFEILYYVPQE